MPPANPHADTAPPYLVIDNRLASVVEPTQSTAPVQRSLASALGGPASSLRSTISAAPRPLRYSASCGRPVTALTLKPRLARMATATEPTPPAAPVTATGPLLGLSPWRS